MSAAVTIDAGRIEFSAPEVVLTHEQTRMHQNFGFHVFSELPGEDRFLFIREPDLGEMSIRYDYIMNWTSTLESVSSLSRTQANR